MIAGSSEFLQLILREANGWLKQTSLLCLQINVSQFDPKPAKASSYKRPWQKNGIWVGSRKQNIASWDPIWKNRTIWEFSATELNHPNHLAGDSGTFCQRNGSRGVRLFVGVVTNYPPPQLYLVLFGGNPKEQKHDGGSPRMTQPGLFASASNGLELAFGSRKTGMSFRPTNPTSSLGAITIRPNTQEVSNYPPQLILKALFREYRAFSGSKCKVRNLETPNGQQK